MSKTPSKVSCHSSSADIAPNSASTHNVNHSQTSITRLAVQSTSRIFPDIFSSVRLRTDDDVISISVNNSKQEVNLPGYIPPTSNENENEVEAPICSATSKASSMARCGSAPPSYYQGIH